MARQWIRSIGLQFGSQLDLSALRVKFEVLQDTIQTPNSAVIRIYNLASSTAQKMKAMQEGSDVVLSAGYVDNPGVIFKGKSKWVNIGRENPTDTFVDIYAGDGEPAYNGAIASKTLAAGSTMMDHVNVMVEAMKPFGVNLGYVPQQLLQQFKYPRSVVFSGMAKDYLRTIAHSIGATWSIQEGELRIVEQGKSLGGGRKMNSATGLVGMPRQTPNGIEFRCLIDPQLKIHEDVQIDQASVQPMGYDLSNVPNLNTNSNRPDITADGAYTMYVINKIGDTHGAEWYMDIVAYAKGQTPPVGSNINNSPSATSGAYFNTKEGG